MARPIMGVLQPRQGVRDVLVRRVVSGGRARRPVVALLGETLLGETEGA